MLSFMALLEKEQAVLIENRIDQLLDLSEQKSAEALNLDQLAAARRALLQKNILQHSIALAGIPATGNPPPGEFSAESINIWLETHHPEGWAIWQKIRDLAYRSQQLNRTNGELIQMKLRQNQQSLAVLSKAADKANLYGPDGQHNFTPGSGRSLGSG